MSNGISNLSLCQLAGFSVLIGASSLLIAADTLEAAGGPGQSHVKVTAAAGTIDKDGQQTITVKMQIGKNWHAYANPVKNENYEPNHTIVKITGTKKLGQVALDYPAGDRQIDGKDTYQVYQGTVEIKANIKRAAGDSGPLEVTVRYVTCNDNLCLPEESVKVQVK